jgi:hypothetical protein
VRDIILNMDRGEDASFDVAAVQADGFTPQPITGATLWFTAKRRREDIDADAVFQKSGAAVAIVDGPGGIARIDLARADTIDVEPVPSTFYWNLKAKIGGKDRTLARGRIKIQPDITRAT